MTSVNSQRSSGSQAKVLSEASEKSGRDRDRIGNLLRLAFPDREHQPHNVHALDHLTECGKALAVGVAKPTVVQFGLVPDADEESRSRSAWRKPRHRQGAIDMAKPGLLCCFVGDRWRIAIPRLIGGITELNDLDLGRHCIGLIGEVDDAVDRRAEEEPGFDPHEQVADGDRRSLRIELDDKPAETRVEGDHRIGSRGHSENILCWERYCRAAETYRSPSAMDSKVCTDACLFALLPALRFIALGFMDKHIVLVSPAAPGGEV